MVNPTEYGGRDLIGYGKNPPNAEWPDNKKIAVNLVINYEEGSELNPLNGDGQSEQSATELGPGRKPAAERDLNTESLYEYGSRAGIWRILNMLDEYDIKATSFAVGQALDLNPDVGYELEKRGHEIASHGWRWIDRSGWSEQEEKENIVKAINSIKNCTESGNPPTGFYYGNASKPLGTRSRALVAETFKKMDIPLEYYCDPYNDDLPYWVPYPGGEDNEGLLIVPYALDSNDAKEFGYHNFGSPNNFADYLIGAFDELYREGLKGQQKMLSIGLHCRTIGRPGRIAGLRKFIEHAKQHDVWFATRQEIATHWKQKFPYNPSSKE